MADGGHGPRTSTGWDMGVYTHWGGAVNGGAGGYQGVYCPPPEHGHTVHCNSYYHGLVSIGGAEDRTAPIQAMVVASHYGYPGDKDGERSSGMGRRRRRQSNWRDRGSRLGNYEGWGMIWIG